MEEYESCPILALRIVSSLRITVVRRMILSDAKKHFELSLAVAHSETFLFYSCETYRMMSQQSLNLVPGPQFE